MNCSHTQNLLSAYVDGELFGPEAAAVAAHVEACPSCQLEFNELTQMKDMLSLLPVVPAPAGLRAGVMFGLQQAALLQAAEAGLTKERTSVPFEPEVRSAARLRFGWRAGVAAAAVAVLAFAGTLRLGPMLPPLVADGQQPGTPTAPGQQPGKVADPGPVTEPAGQEQPGDSPAVVDEPNPTDVAAEPNTGSPGDEPTPSTDVAVNDQTPDTEPISQEPAAPPPPTFNDNRFATANVNHLESDRLVAKTIQISLILADPDTYVASLAEIAAKFGGYVETDAAGDLALVVPHVDVMKVINSVGELSVRETTLKIVEAREVDLTEAIRNLVARREFLARELRAVDDNDDSISSELQAADDVLAGYYHQVEHLRLEIKAQGPAS